MSPTHQLDSAVSVMLLGSISFHMSLFYLVNHKDEDIKRYSWQVISCTISIFCAVLLFQALNGFFEKYMGHHHSVALDMGHLLFWLLALQLLLAYMSGVIGTRPPRGNKKAFERSELNVRCLAMLLGHIVGFAAINGFGALQQTEEFKKTPLTAQGVVLIGAVAFFVCFGLFSRLRQWVALQDDGEVDEYEEAWEEEASEVEDEVAGFSLSFLTCQALRYMIGGVLPDKEGEEEEHAHDHSGSQVLQLGGAGLLFGLLAMGALIGRRRMFGKHGHGVKARVAEVIQTFLGMGFAWCCFFATEWWLASKGFFIEGHVMLSVVLAMVVSFGSFVLIFLLDFLADRQAKGFDFEVALRILIDAIGILVGFSWERSFDKATHALASNYAGQLELKHPRLFQAILGGFLVSLVVPAWRIYILPLVVELQKEAEGESESEDEHHDHHKKEKPGAGHPPKVQPMKEPAAPMKTKPGKPRARSGSPGAVKKKQ